LCEHWILEMQNCICTLYWMDAGDAKLHLHTLLHSVLRKVGWHFTRAEQNVVVPLERTEDLTSCKSGAKGKAGKKWRVWLSSST
jgi:hypothetical protein